MKRKQITLFLPIDLEKLLQRATFAQRKEDRKTTIHDIVERALREYFK
jgi:hypothetical protein